MSEILEEEFESDLLIKFEATHIRTLFGARNSFGVPEEPDEKIYQYKVQGVSLAGIELDVLNLGIEGSYDEVQELIDNVVEKFQDAIKEKLG